MTDQLPVRMDEDRRDLRLDACRGLALWFIFVDHIPNNSLDWLTLRNYGFSDARGVCVCVGLHLHARLWRCVARTRVANDGGARVTLRLGDLCRVPGIADLLFLSGLVGRRW